MALIGKIRSSSWILIVFIGLGLGGFLIMDTCNSQTGMFQGNATLLANIDGRKVDIQEFNQTESARYGNSGGDVYGRRDFLWQYFVEETLVNKETEAIGLGVSDVELQNLQFGPNDKLSPVIVRNFQDVQTRQVNRQILDQYKTAIADNTLTGNIRTFWAEQQKEIVKERLQAKMVTMVEKGLYTPTWMAEMMNSDDGTKVDFAYVQIPFDEIDNDEVSLADADYEKYLAEHQSEYRQDEETRRIDYVVFNVSPSAEDSTDIRKSIADDVPAFETTDNDSVFVETHYGTISAQWLTKDDLAPAIADTVFKMSAGTVYGPYEDAGKYKAVKILESQVMPDSAKSRHILISASTPAQFAQAAKTIDSLKNLIETGAHRFDSLAVKFSQDPGSASKGGEYENVAVNQFVPEYNDIIFYTGQIGRLYSARTSYGVHLIEPMSRTSERTARVRLAYIEQPIIPSEKTQEAMRDKALEFSETYRTVTDLTKAASENPDLNLETSPAFKQNDYAIGSLGSGNASREIVRWAFNYDRNSPDAEVGDVAPDIYSYQDPVEYYTNKYVVVALKGIQEAGMPSAEVIKSDIELQVMNMKKGELLKERLAGKTDLQAIAGGYDVVKVDTAQNVSFGSTSIPSVGSEPKVVSSAFNLDVNSTSEPIVGNSGVFVIMPTFKPAPAVSGTVPQTRINTQRNTRTQVRARLMQALRKNADIEDLRAKWF